MNRLIVPDTGVELHDGSIVILNRFPGTKWIVHNGWYSYQDQQYMGWYFCSIPSQTILPVSDEDLRMLTVVSDGECPCPPGPKPPMPFPDVPFTPQNAYELDRAWISVETIAQRDQLNKRLLPNGKIVRVNNVSGQAKYYIWNQVTQVWEDETFGIDLSLFLTEEEADKKYVASADLPEQVNSILENNADVISTITQIAGGVVDSAIEPIQTDITQIVSRVNIIDNAIEWKNI